VLAISVLIAAGALALASSVVFNWASGKSAVWNMGFAVALVVLLATVLLVAIMIDDATRILGAKDAPTRQPDIRLRGQRSRMEAPMMSWR
jgi:hypothetical protein